MAEEATQATQEQAAGPRLALQKIYIKDAAFEVPKGHESFQKQLKPEVKLDMNLAIKNINETNYELTLGLTVTAVNDGENAFLVEIQQAGIFLIDGMSEEQRRQVLNTACANMVFPYAREAIDSMVTKGGFPALMLAPINFDAVYQQAVARRQAEQQAEGSEALN